MARSGQDAQQRPLQSSGRGFGGAEPLEGRERRGPGQGWAGAPPRPAAAGARRLPAYQWHIQLLWAFYTVNKYIQVTEFVGSRPRLPQRVAPGRLPAAN